MDDGSQTDLFLCLDYYTSLVICEGKVVFQIFICCIQYNIIMYFFCGYQSVLECFVQCVSAYVHVPVCASVCICCVCVFAFL